MADQIRTDLDWEDIRVFAALARHGSLSAAARALGVNHATVSRRVKSLERATGARLAERRTDGYVLTPAGTRVLGLAGDMERAASALRRGGGDEQPTGLVRINAPPTLSHGFLIERLARLVQRNPALDIDLAPDVRLVSLERRETDIALRYGRRPQDGHVVAKPLLTVGFGFYGTPALCRRAETGGEPPFVGFDEANAHLPEAVWLARHFPRRRVSLRTSSQVSQALAARAGAGLALLPHFLGRRSAGLRPCPLAHDPPGRELWLIMRAQDRKDVAIRAAADHLTGIFTEERALFTT
ncbi:MAG: LysR family transcriptional regulator [Bradyrhizobiaceae bacterium]|nr:MAG: LysR family transcriptional regulator [Bradyrhizobiaceae bacterium]